jgi:hypothetical protein
MKTAEMQDVVREVQEYVGGRRWVIKMQE